NLGKIVAATIKGMMGSTLGATVEGESATVIENKPTQSATPFMVVFDEVGYYTAPGMAVMAAQARSLGFCLIFSAQDLPALEKRVKEEARSITANCNIKIFGKLEDPTQTKEFFEKTVGSAFVIESSGFQMTGGRSTGSYYDTMQAGLQVRSRASYEGLRAFKEGEAVIAFGEMVVDTQIFYSNPGFAKAMRVTRYMALPPPDENIIKHADAISKVRDRLVHKTWTAMKADVAIKPSEEIDAIAKIYATAKKAAMPPIESGMAAIASIHAMHNPADLEAAGTHEGGGDTVVPAAAAVSPAVSVTAAPVIPATPAEPPASGGGPMSFFGKKKSGGDVAVAPPASPPAAPAEIKEPINWQDLVNLSTTGQPMTPDMPWAAPAVLLPPQAEETLKNAGKSIRDILFKSRSEDDKSKS
ncbi:MAG TPA: TraM recognition domain-containing protein, partial [Alphaproteobacteria bacterium]